MLFLVFFIVVQNEDMKGFASSSHTHTHMHTRTHARTHLLFILKHKISPPSVVQEEVVAALAARGLLPYLRGDDGSFSYVNSLDAAVN